MLNGVKVIIISAVSIDGVIGIDEKIPWKIPEDFKHFRDITIGNLLIIGYNTFETLPAKALENREYMVLNGDNPFPKKSVAITYRFKELNTVLQLIGSGKNKFDKVFVAGGAMVYEAFMEYADEAIITWVNKTYPEGNKKFPIDKLFSNFDEYSDQDWQKSKSGLSYKITYYKRSDGSPKKT